MSNPIILFLFFIVFTIFSIDSAHSSSSSACPIDLSYVETYPWNTSSCHYPNDKSCSQTLISLIGLGLSQYLKETSMFQLPNASAASSCWSEFQARLAALSISPSLVPLCFYNSTQFVANSSSCAGIFTTKDWTEKVGPESQIDIACSNLSGSLIQCGSCVDAGKKVTSQLVSLAPNNSAKCWYFSILYAAGVINDPKDANTAACILGLPLIRSRTNQSSSQLNVARGLAYLHYGLKPAIYHRDIKPTNILLDSDLNARVADFGLAKQSLEGQSHLTTRVAGTHGYLAPEYLAPEYALYGQLTEKSDVYSFGIVMLEIMSGRKVLDTSNSSSFLLITDWAWMLVKTGKVEEIFDEFIRKEGPKGIMERFVQVGILCAHVMVAFRPTIADALKMLEGDIDIPILPDRPLPLSHESFRSSLCNNVSTSEISESRSTFTT
ncbi:hypothetical protein LWI29_018672 [Acer saccharum]|uniref:non-specific serine/threonine protein kinase n=1 Tax=Acer saccharum TaxID=4024 RepID=A0AA39RL54_ACESA|nr:hypothetical protein LWI29_018672 [Acer saccharum]